MICPLAHNRIHARLIGDNLPGTHPHHPVAFAGQFLVMRHQYKGSAARLVQIE